MAPPGWLHVHRRQPPNGGRGTSSKGEKGRIVAVGLLTQRDLNILGSGFRRAIPLDQADGFDHLLVSIDEAERLWKARP
jgi:hypothetical protein